MAIYAKVNNDIVQKVIVADANFFDTFVDDSAGKYIETSPTGEFRANYAGVGMFYNEAKDVFYNIEPPYPSWVLNNTTYKYEPPVAYPNDGKIYEWDESTKSWKENLT
tara:strand:+ start:188 stop:511 length:324 start_codon:yes stop_codon:yes gene_type:complete